jgi:heme-degrading monooxygenase HmoA
MHVVLGRVSIRADSASEWDSQWLERAEGARRFPGWKGAELLVPVDRPNERVIVGWWATREDFDHWRSSSEWESGEEQLRQHQLGSPEIEWHEVRTHLEE